MSESGKTLPPKLKEIIMNNAQLTQSPEEIGLEVKLTDIGVNSINFIKIIIAIGKEFGFQISNQDLDIRKFSTFQALISFVEGRMA